MRTVTSWASTFEEYANAQPINEMQHKFFIAVPVSFGCHFGQRALARYRMHRNVHASRKPPKTGPKADNSDEPLNLCFIILMYVKKFNVK